MDNLMKAYEGSISILFKDLSTWFF